jgi:hypothetical protein
MVPTAATATRVGPWVDGNNGELKEVRQTIVSGFLCPSDSNGKAPSTDDARINYATCYGDWADAGSV